VNLFKLIRKRILDQTYSEVERWQRHFYNLAVQNRKHEVSKHYYGSAASGLGIALQCIDEARYARTAADVWREYIANDTAAELEDLAKRVGAELNSSVH